MFTGVLPYVCVESLPAESQRLARENFLSDKLRLTDGNDEGIIRHERDKFITENKCENVKNRPDVETV